MMFAGISNNINVSKQNTAILTALHEIILLG